MSYQEALSAFFIDRRESEGNYCDLNCSPRDPDECKLCKKGTMLHFDIAQKNTIIWSSEDEIAERLMSRIRATID